MLLTIQAKLTPGSDFGFLLGKNPANPQTKERSFGNVHMFYPEVTEDSCTFCLLLDINQITNVYEGKGGEFGRGLDQFVNDRAYVATSHLSTSIAKVLGSALGGESKERPELAKTPLPLTATIDVVHCDARDGEGFLRKLFEPLGYAVTVIQYPTDPNFPEWGPSPYFSLTLSQTTTLSTLLSHLYVLTPVIDNHKHYDIGEQEVQKLLDYGGEWLARHPLRSAIVRRYLKKKRKLVEHAAERLDELLDEQEQSEAAEEKEKESKGLHQLRLRTVAAVLKEVGAKRVLDAGCGSGQLLELLDDEPQFTEIVGLDLSLDTIGKARWWLKKKHKKEHGAGKEPLPRAKGAAARVSCKLGSLVYSDPTLKGFDAVACVEVIEHIDPWRLDAFERSIFAIAAPQHVVLTTPNVEYNCKFETLAAGKFRHSDHRFEWTRAEFQAWCLGVAERRGYKVSFRPLGEEDPVVGAPSQMAIFCRRNNPDATCACAKNDGEICGENEVGSAVTANGSDRFMDLNLDDVLRAQVITTRLLPKGVFIPPDQANLALEEMSRFAVDPRWLIYVPPTMAPAETSNLPGYLEHPNQVFDYYLKQGVTRVICERKHMGSRAVVIVCKDADAARRRFGVTDGSAGVCYSRMGRRFFRDPQLEAEVFAKVRAAMTGADMWNKLGSDWVVLDCELMPWNAKASELVKGLFAGLAAAGEPALTQTIERLNTTEARGLDVRALIERMTTRLECVREFRKAYFPYCWDVQSLADYKLAPFHILASEGHVHTDKNHLWHLELIAELAAASDGMIISTPFLEVDLNDSDSREAAVRWWNELTAEGGEGMVVKPLDFLAMAAEGVVQPAVKCRGQQYLRIIYGPEYLLEHNLVRLRKRSVSGKRWLAAREFALGIEGLERFVAGEPLTRVHECAYGAIALETERPDRPPSIDPRL